MTQSLRPKSGTPLRIVKEINSFLASAIYRDATVVVAGQYASVAGKVEAGSNAGACLRHFRLSACAWCDSSVVFRGAGPGLRPVSGGRSLAAGGGCLTALRRVPAPARPGWAYLAIALVLTAVNTLVCLWVYRVRNLSYDHANISDFLYIFNYIFLVLAVTWSREEAAGKWFFCFDAAQALIATLLSYILLFDALPFSGQPLTRWMPHRWCAPSTS
jgi:hypothetical protein